MKLLPLLASTLLVSTALAAELEWPQFRGPNCTGRAAANANPPTEFSATKNVRWKAELPGGASSPVVAKDRLFVTGFDGKKLEVICLDRADGSTIWRRTAHDGEIEPFFAKYGTPAAASCATDGEHVVSYFGSCGLVCHDIEGRELWRVPMPVIKTQDGFGSGNSPVIRDGRVLLLRDETGDAAGLYAFDARTGAQLWRTPRKDFRSSYGTPVIWDDAIVTIGDLRVKAYDLATGAERWFVRGIAAYPCTTAAVGEDGNLYVATWSSGSSNEPNPDFDQLLKLHDKDNDGALQFTELANTPLKDFAPLMDDNQNEVLESWEWDFVQKYMRAGQNAVLCIRPGGKGDITDTHVAWKNDRGASYVASPLAYGSRLFIAKDGGFATAYDAKTGKLLFEKQRLGAEGDYFASPVLAAGKIYACSQRGVVSVIDAAADKLTILARNDLAEPIAATPAIVGDTIYIRTGSHLWAFGAK